MATKIRNLILSSTPARLLYGWKEIRNHISHFNRDLIFCKIYLLFILVLVLLSFYFKAKSSFRSTGYSKVNARSVFNVR